MLRTSDVIYDKVIYLSRKTTESTYFYIFTNKFISLAKNRFLKTKHFKSIKFN